MDSNKKQTSVEWLEARISEYGKNHLFSLRELIKQAKELEKQQIVDAYHINPLESKWGNIGIDYYTETYGGNNG